MMSKPDFSKAKDARELAQIAIDWSRMTNTIVHLDIFDTRDGTVEELGDLVNELSWLCYSQSKEEFRADLLFEEEYEVWRVGVHFPKPFN